MPVIDIQYQKGSLTEVAKAELPTRLGQIAIGYEGLEGSQFAREFTWVYLHEMPANQVTQVSGAPPKPIYRLRFTTLQSLLNNQSKHRLGEDVTRAIYEAEGSAWNEEEAYNRVWIFFEDVREGDWIAGARINSLKGLHDKLAEEKAVTTG